MRKSDVFPYYKQCAISFGEVYETVSSLFEVDSIDKLCAMRGYTGGEQKKLLTKMNIGACEIYDTDLLGDMKKDLGLVSAKGNYIISSRFTIPVYDLKNNIVALIGYYADYKKYITTPSPFFSKNVLFFNFRQAYELSYREYNGLVFVVEGIFDCLSLRALGLPCIATMGANISSVKCELLKMFKKVIGIPDNDATGRLSLNRYDRKHGWCVPYNATMVKLVGGTVNLGGNAMRVKDIDNLVSWFDADDVRSLLLSFRDSNKDIDELAL